MYANICTLCNNITDGKTIEWKTNNSSWFNAFFGQKYFSVGYLSYHIIWGFKAWELYEHFAISTSGNSE